MKILLRLLSLFILLSTVNTVEATFYKYTDESGAVRYVDDIGKVPRDQRKTAKPYKESAKEDAATTTVTNPDEPIKTLPEASKIKSPQDKKFDFDSEKKRLESIKKEIDTEYKALINEKKRLTNEKGRAKTKEEILTHQHQVETFNNRTIQYLEKQKQFNSELEYYNQQVKLQNSSIQKREVK